MLFLRRTENFENRPEKKNLRIEIQITEMKNLFRIDAGIVIKVEAFVAIHIIKGERFCKKTKIAELFNLKNSWKGIAKIVNSVNFASLLQVFKF